MSDRSQGKKHKTDIGQLIGFACFMFIGGACGIFFLQFTEHLKYEIKTVPMQILMILLLIVCVYGSLMFQIIIHEAGHLVFGLLTGYRFSSFRVAGLMWIKEGGRIRLKRMTVAGTGGQCLMIPPELSDGRMPVMLYNFGGAIVNTVMGTASLILSFLLPAYSLGWMILVINAVIGYVYAFMNGVPLKMGPVNNDGRNALDLAHSSEATRAFWIQMKSNEMISKGIRLKDMPKEWFAVPSDESMKNGIIATVGVLACNRLMDEHRFTEADEMMEHMLSLDGGIVGLYRNLLTCDRMYVQLINGGDAAAIEEMCSKEQLKLMKTMKNYPSVLRTEYAYALIAEKNREKAEEIKKKFEICAKRFPYPAEIETEREFMEIAGDKDESY